MKSKFLSIGLIAAMMVPAVAEAQTRQIERDRQEVREQKRDVREARQDLRQSKQDWRRDARYQNYRAPFRYQQFNVGATLRPNYYAPAYRPAWDSRWGVPRAGRNLTYVRNYNDLLLVNVRNGKVVKVYRNMFAWR